MKQSSYAKGKEAEAIIVRYLEDKGWKVLATNYRTSGAEIDIVALDRTELVIVEVKSGKGDVVSLSESVTQTKRKRIERAAQEFRHQKRMRHCTIRFDIIALSMPEKKIHHFQEEFFDE